MLRSCKDLQRSQWLTHSKNLAGSYNKFLQQNLLSDFVKILQEQCIITKKTLGFANILLASWNDPVKNVLQVLMYKKKSNLCDFDKVSLRSWKDIGKIFQKQCTQKQNIL